MTAHKFIFSPEPFDAVQWDGTNIDEILQFVPGTVATSSGSGLLALKFPTELAIVAEVGWWVAARDGDVWVSSEKAAASWIPTSQDD